MNLLNTKNADLFFKEVSTHRIFCHLVLNKSNETHPAENSPSILFLRDATTNKDYILNVTHQDIPTTSPEFLFKIFTKLCSVSEVFVLDKKRTIHTLPSKVYDLNLWNYINSSEIIEVPAQPTFGFRLNESFESDVNLVTPISKHYGWFKSLCGNVSNLVRTLKFDDSYLKVNGDILNILYQFEKNGLEVDVPEFKLHFPHKVLKTNRVHTEYNLLTSTGRPSNRFSKINYAALNTEDGCRKSFISRFGSSGRLLDIDYSAYHPHIIAQQINYHVPVECDIYREFAKQYFEKEEVSDEEVKYTKNLTFKNLYGNISDDVLKIEFFSKTQEYIEHRWKFFCMNEYVETPVFKRRITVKNMESMSPNKLFNYILQASELEYVTDNLLNTLIYLSDKKTVPILYTYDSILFDLNLDDGDDVIPTLKRLLSNGKFPVKCKIGTNYGEMEGLNADKLIFI